MTFERNNEPILVVDSVGKQFSGRRILNSAYFHGVSGKVNALVGRNGSGKTTLMKIAAGLIPADYGNVRYHGHVRTHPKLWLLAREGLFYWPASRRLLSPNFTVAAHFRGLSQLCNQGHYDQVVRSLRIRDLLARRASELSGGESQRCHLAMALIRQPACLLADEPFRGVAPLDAELMTTELRNLASAGCAIVISGHELTFVMDVADEITWVAHGTTRFFSSREIASEDPTFREGFLGWWPPSP